LDARATVGTERWKAGEVARMPVKDQVPAIYTCTYSMDCVDFHGSAIGPMYSQPNLSQCHTGVDVAAKGNGPTEISSAIIVGCP
jgi:hypothetical protein